MRHSLIFRFLNQYKTHLIVAVAACIYLWVYFLHEALPGNNPLYPLGWWGWFDQGEYLKAAMAMSNADWSSSQYYYPPVYSMLGAFFVKILPMHAFLPLNLLCFMAFTYFFIAFAKKYITWGGALIVFVMSFYTGEPFFGHALNPQDRYPGETLLRVWVEPWTTTLIAPLIAYLIWSVDRYLSSNHTPRILTCCVWGCAGGVIAATRPVEAVILIPLFTYVLANILFGTFNHAKQPRLLTRVLCGGGLLTSGIFWVLFFLVFNIYVHGSLEGRYFAVNAQGNGFHPMDIVEKFIAIFLDSQTLYNVSNAAIYKKMPWLALSIPAFIYVLLKGNAILRLVVITIILQFLAYLPYSDLLPNGLWNYQNIHYFKWTFAFSLVCMAWVGIQLVHGLQTRSKAPWMVYGVSFLVALPMLCLQNKLVDVNGYQLVITTTQGTVDIVLHDEVPHTVELISLPFLTGTNESVYFGRENKVWVDGQEMKFVRDYRFLMADSGVQLLFIRPITARTIKIQPALLKDTGITAGVRLFKTRLSLGRPSWL